MKKDDKIEQRFQEYFGGNEAPDCDLTQAKRIVAAEHAAKKRRTKIFLRFASAFACIAIVFTVCALYLPSVFGKKDVDEPPNGGTAEAPNDSSNDANAAPGSSAPSEGNEPGVSDSPSGEFISPKKFALSQTVAHPLDGDEIQASYANQTEIFSPFEWADNTSCSYTLYEYEDTAVLLRADLRYGGGMKKFDATVYVDLTEGNYTVTDFEEYRALGENKIKTEYLNGEYVSYGYVVSENTPYYTQVTSPQKSAAEFLFHFLKK